MLRDQKRLDRRALVHRRDSRFVNELPGALWLVSEKSRSYFDWKTVLATFMADNAFGQPT